MTQDEIIEMARQAGFDVAFDEWHWLESFAKLVTAKEREACAKICDEFCYGSTKILRASLTEWRILRGEGKFKYVYNWNGEISPVVHQLDRFL
jgi:hypothetical protein